jgi:antitoxin VapB
MSLNIKDPEAHALARKLAKATGQSMTRAVIEAMREKLVTLGPREEKRATVEEIMAIARKFASHMKEPGHSLDHGELLYDEWGLPK